MTNVLGAFARGAVLLVSFLLLVLPTATASSLLGKITGGTLNTAEAVVQPIIDPITGALSLPDGGLQHTLIRLDGTYLVTAPGTVGYQQTITVDGVERSFVALRPDPAPPSAPVLLLLHGNSGTPANMANLAEVSDFVATQGFWAVMPAALNGVWGDDPSTDSDADVRFISQLIDTLIAAGGMDSTRIYASGLSNGGFMTERLSCELSDKIAAFAMVAATLRTGLEQSCAPAIQRPKLFILGTADPIVPYRGVANIESADSAVSFWAAQQGCITPSTTRVPNTVNDGTSIDLQTYESCSSGADLRLYTVNGGGHAWPGGWQYLPVPVIGATSQNLIATGVIWAFDSDSP